MVEDSASIVSSPEGASVHAVLVFRDVTEQRRAEAELRGTVERLRLALEVGRLMPWELTLATGELTVHGIEALLPGAAINHRDDYAKFIHPDDREMIHNLIMGAIENKRTYAGAYRLVKPDGGLLWVESRGQPLYDAGGKAVKVLGILRDLTEQKLVEQIVRDGQEQFRNVAESASDGFVTIDEKGKILYANAAFAAIFGYKRSDLIGQSLSILIPESLRSRHKEGFERFFKTGVRKVDWRHVEFPGLRKDGSEAALEMSLSESRTGAKRLYSAIVRDISERKRAERLVMAARERLLLVQRIAGIGTFEINLLTKRRSMSPELEAMYGLPVGGFEGTQEHWIRLLHPGDAGAAGQRFQAALEAGSGDYANEYRIVWPDKSVHWIASNGKIFRDEKGRGVWMLGADQDITRRKEAEAEREKLLDSERAARGRLLVAHRIAGIGTYELDLRTGRADMSRESAALYGLKPDDVFGSREHWVTRVYPADRDTIQNYLRSVLQSGADDYQSEFRIVWPDGSVRWLATKGKIFRDEHGVPVKMLGAEQDITRRKETEAEREKLLVSERLARERLELAQRAGKIGIYERDLKSGMLKLSPELAALMGLFAGGFSGRFEDWLNLVHPDDRASVLNGVEEAIRLTSEYYFEYRVVWPDGSVHWLASSGKVICGADGKPELSVGATHEITQRKALEAERERIIEREKTARTEAERASNLKDEFLATVSHELRTPLTAILGWSQLLLDGPLEPDQIRRGAESIDRNARVQAQLVEDLLDISRIVTGRMRIKIEPLDLAEVVAAAVEGLRPAAQAKKIKIETNLSRARVNGDPERLQQVAFNILFNAVKFSEQNGLVEVSVVLDRHTARMVVRDHGRGISPAFLAGLFQRFSQEDSSSTRRHGGMGLGLAIAKQLVELHGGSVRAESEGEGKGTTMIVELPALKQGDTALFNFLATPT